MYPYYTFMDEVNKVVNGQVVKGLLLTSEEEDAPIQCVTYTDGTVEEIKLAGLKRSRITTPEKGTIDNHSISIQKGRVQELLVL